MRRQKHGHIINVRLTDGSVVDSLPGVLFRQQVRSGRIHRSVASRGQTVSTFTCPLTEAGFLKTPMMDHRQVGANRITEYDPWREAGSRCDSFFGREESWPGAGGRNAARDPFQRHSAATLPDRTASEIRHASAAISPRGNVRTGSAAYLFSGQDSIRRLTKFTRGRKASPLCILRSNRRSRCMARPCPQTSALHDSSRLSRS